MAVESISHRDGKSGKYLPVHGLEQHPLYHTWRNMVNRCTNSNRPDYERYGGRGITVCARWIDSPQLFIDDMGERPAGHSIDRIDNDKGYSPDNCRWATASQQGKNTRRARKITHNGLTLCLSEWSEKLGIPRLTIYRRLRRGMSVADALATPSHLNIITHNGKTMCASDWAAHFGLKQATFAARLRKGEPIERASRPVGV